MLLPTAPGLTRDSLQKQSGSMPAGVAWKTGKMLTDDDDDDDAS